MTYELIAIIRKSKLLKEINSDRVFSELYNEEARPGWLNKSMDSANNKIIHLTNLINPQKFYSGITRAGYSIIETKLKEEN